MKYKVFRLVLFCIIPSWPLPAGLRLFLVCVFSNFPGSDLSQIADFIWDNKHFLKGLYGTNESITKGGVGNAVVNTQRKTNLVILTA